MEKRTFKTYQDQELAEEVLEILKNKGFDASLVRDSSPLNITFSGSDIPDDYRVLLFAADFERAHECLESHGQIDLKDMPEGHYLNDFSIDELRQVVLKKDEWSEVDYNWASQLLALKGASFSTEEIKNINETRLKELSSKKHVALKWLIPVYFFAVFGWYAGFLFGAFSLVSGWVYVALKKTLPNGEQVFVYDEESRRHGKFILALNGFSMLGILFILLDLFYNFTRINWLYW